MRNHILGRSFGIFAALPVMLGAQPAVNRANPPAPDGYQVVERGQHHRIWQRAFQETLPNGQVIERKSGYVEIAPGMHYLKTNRWEETREELELFKDSVVARQGPHQVIWAANLNSPWAIDVLAADAKRFRSRILGLAYFDAASGQSALISELRDSFAEVAGNQVVYRDAFDGPFQADVKYEYTSGGFEQNIVLKQRPPSPADYGFNPLTTRLEVWTEFQAPPVPSRRLSVLRVESDLDLRQRMIDPDLTDEFLDFGAMHIGSGNAFPEGAGARFVGDGESPPVGKSWMTLQGRTFLIEKMDFDTAREQLERLPRAAGVVRPDRDKMQAAARLGPRETLLAVSAHEN